MRSLKVYQAISKWREPFVGPYFALSVIAAELSSSTTVGPDSVNIPISTNRSRSHAFSLPNSTKEAHSASVDEDRTRVLSFVL